jgi:hypothetical protein
MDKAPRILLQFFIYILFLLYCFKFNHQCWGKIDPKSLVKMGNLKKALVGSSNLSYSCSH